MCSLHMNEEQSSSRDSFVLIGLQGLKLQNLRHEHSQLDLKVTLRHDYGVWECDSIAFCRRLKLFMFKEHLQNYWLMTDLVKCDSM